VLHKDRKAWEDEYWAEFGPGFELDEFRYLVRQWMEQATYRKIPTPRSVRRLNGYPAKASDTESTSKRPQMPPVDPNDPLLAKGLEYLKSHGLELPKSLRKKLVEF
jgi:hypothetical protein